MTEITDRIEREVYDAIEAGTFTRDADILGFIRKTPSGRAHPNAKRAVANALRKLSKHRMIVKEQDEWRIRPDGET